jgi:hypothetical protein
MRIPALLILGTAAVFVFGCASKEEPAKQAVASVDAALGEVRPNAVKYAPQQLSAAEASLANLKRDLSNEKYKTVLLHAPDVNKEVGALKEMVVAKQTQVAAATREWEELSQDVPPMVKAIQVRVDNLTGTRLPREVKKESFEAAKAELAQLKSQWSAASAAYDAGNATQAADMGRAVQARAKEISEQLGISPA